MAATHQGTQIQFFPIEKVQKWAAGASATVGITGVLIFNTNQSAAGTFYPFQPVPLTASMGPTLTGFG